MLFNLIRERDLFFDVNGKESTRKSQVNITSGISRAVFQLLQPTDTKLIHHLKRKKKKKKKMTEKEKRARRNKVASRAEIIAWRSQS